MGISAFDPKTLVAKGQAGLNSPFAKAMDWVLAGLSVVFAAWAVWSDWPRPGVWAWALVVFAVLGVLLAAWDWKTHLRKGVEKAFLVRKG